jgi:hypothetical protein
MQLTRALFAFFLAMTMAFAPVATSAAGWRATCESNPPCASMNVDLVGATVEAADFCEKMPKPIEEKSKGGHCGGCCLAHSNGTLSAADTQISKVELWAISLKPHAEAPFALPHRLYGLKRPPRA